MADTCKNGHDLGKYRFIKKDGTSWGCKRCRNQSHQIWAKKQYAKDPLWMRKRKLKQKFGITMLDYERLLTSQHHACAICGTMDFRGKFGDVDHCHETGLVRGILCQKCNKGLGLFNDNRVLLLNAIEYLNKNIKDR